VNDEDHYKYRTEPGKVVRALAIDIVSMIERNNMIANGIKLLLGVLFTLLLIQPAAAQVDTSKYDWVEVVGGLDNPLLLTNAGDGSGRLFAVEQTGFIWVIQDGQLSDQPFLDIYSLLYDDVFRGGYTERGLLGLAFHPGYEDNGLFFIDYTDTNGDTVVARYKVSADDPNVADPSSAVTLLTQDQPFENHNGGGIAFGPDGYLYIAFGDGGSQGDPQGNGQNKNTFLAKILRIDVNADTYVVPDTNPFVGQPDAKPEVWAIGLRNPWRFSFDRKTGDLYLADVGGDDFEEVDFQPSDSKGGENFGWNAWEGNERHAGREVNGEVVPPIATYPHSAGCSITGGYVYRGSQLPELDGIYFFGDYCNGRIWMLERNGAGQWTMTLSGWQPGRFVVTSFGEDEDGELYLVDYKGSIYRLEAVSQ
jgi:glucose/arabinose dehydrogenase